jgi:large repetitive protein
LGGIATNGKSNKLGDKKMKKVGRVLAVNMLIAIFVAVLFSLSFAIEAIKPQGIAPVIKTPIIDPHKGQCKPVNFTSQKSLPQATVGQQYQFQLQTSGGTGNITYKIIFVPYDPGLPPGLTLSSNGLISGRIPVCGAALSPMYPEYYSCYFKIKATDSCPSGSLSVDERFYLDVKDPCEYPFNNNAVDLPDSIVGQHFKYQLTANGKPKPPLTFVTLSGKSLPQGLSLSSTGEISGVPNTPMDYGVPISVTDSCQLLRCAGGTEQYISYTQQIILYGKVRPPCKALTFTDTSLGYAQVGQSYQEHFSVDGEPPYTFSIPFGSLPEDINLNAATGEITGTPKSAGNYSFRIRVTDSCFSGKQSVDKIISMTVK